MATIVKPRRKQIYWWQLPVKPVCPHCGLVCTANGTVTTEEGKKTQNRYCPNPDCTYSVKTVIRDGE